jgi:hypothetical protein
MQPQQPTPDLSTLSYRMANVEKDIEIVQKQLQSYVPLSVNDWQLREKDTQLKGMQQTLDRMEREQQSSKTDHVQQLKDLNDKIDTQSSKIDKLQIKGLSWIVITVVSIVVSIVVTVASSLIVFYFTHPTGG